MARTAADPAQNRGELSVSHVASRSKVWVPRAKNTERRALVLVLKAMGFGRPRAFHVENLKR
jgi:hypothetical protein